MVGVIVHKYDDTLLGQDHRAEGRPGRDVHGYLRWNVGVLVEAGRLERRCVVTHSNKVAVAYQESHHVVRVGVNPGIDIGKVLFGGTGVEKVARGVAI